jgi:cellulose biosynthesis protein BcsQ
VNVVSVCSLKGGVGKTSVVLGLASAAWHRGLPTLVVDLDPQGDSTLGLDVAVSAGMPTVADVLAARGHRPLAPALVPSGWGDGGPGVLDVLPGSPDSAGLDSPRPGERSLVKLRNVLGQAEDYRLVLLDCPPSLGGLTRTGLIASDRAIIVSEPALFSVAAADRALKIVHELRDTLAPSLQPLGVLVNRFRERSPEHRYRLDELGSMFGPLVLSPAVAERSAFQQALGASQPIHRWPGQAAKELSGVFDTHLSRILRTDRRSPEQRHRG